MAAVPLPRLLLLLLVIPLVVADAARVPSTTAAEADALLQLKSGLKDDNNALLSWVPGTTPCNGGDGSSWMGVLCNKDGIHGLQLEGMGLSGTLDLRPLKALRGLRTLSFMGNDFTGAMPDIKDLSGLRAIFLTGNKFSGEIPADAFAGMGSLKKVVLSENNFTGPIPASLADVPKLLELQLNDNKFTGKIPNLPQKELKMVNLANNQLEGEIPPNLKSMNPEMFAGNKKLCGGPLGTKCEATPSSPPPSTEKVGTPPPSTPAQDAATSTGGPLNDEAAQVAAKPTDGRVGPGVLGALLGTLVIAALVFVFMQRRRDSSNNSLSPTAAAAAAAPKPTMEPQPPAKDARPAHLASRGDEEKARGSTVRKAEQMRLTFVRDDRGRFFELQDLLKATAEVLGAANLGVCYRASLPSGHSVVVKRFKEMNRVGKEDFEEHMRRLGRLSHPNLLPLVAYYYRKEEKLFIHDYVPNRSLANLLHGEGKGLKKAVVHFTLRLKIIKGVARALNYLYDELCMLTVPHGHLKSSNVLLNERFEPLLTDYALVPVMNQSHAAQLMVAFKSPERKQFGRSSKKSDVWCLGLLILEIITGRPASYDTAKPTAADTQPAPAAGTDLVGLLSSTPEGQWMDTVVDEDLRDDAAGNKEEIVKLLRIGMACCEANADSRWEIKNAIDGIEELKGKESNEEHSAFYSSVNDEDD